MRNGGSFLVAILFRLFSVSNPLPSCCGPFPRAHYWTVPLWFVSTA
jgi:hypothetical protein